MNVWWLIARTPTGGHSWELGNPDPVVLENLVVRAKALLGWPYGDATADIEQGWVLTLAPGEPHPSLRAVCAHREVAELSRVTDSAVQVWLAGDAAARREAELAAVQSAVLRLSPADSQTLRSRLGWDTAPKPSTSTGGGKA